MDYPGRLWQRIHAAFEGHRKRTDPTAQAALERIAEKCLGLPGRQSFNASNCLVREVELLPQELSDLRVYHSRDRPARDGGDIVLIRYQGCLVVLDGNNRVNRWRTQSVPGPFKAIVIEPSGDGA
jgi:hypothetical protein